LVRYSVVKKVVWSISASELNRTLFIFPI
jgi:hypothetical protein